MAGASRLHFLPLVVFFLFPLTFITTFSIAVKLGHIKAFFSYISDTGTFAPEMCVFGLGLSLAMIFIAAVAYIRYMQVAEFFKQKGRTDKAGNILNKVGLFFGIVAALGSCVVGAFQETSVLSIHFIGASMAFGGGSVFLIIQGFLTKKMAPQVGSSALAYIRIFIGFCCLILYFVCMGTGVESLKHFKGEKSVLWEPHHGGWELHVISTVTEWIMAALFDLYFLTFVPEFRRISYTGPQFQLVEVTTRTSTGYGGTKVQSTVVHQQVHYNNNNE